MIHLEWKEEWLEYIHSVDRHNQLDQELGGEKIARLEVRESGGSFMWVDLG